MQNPSAQVWVFVKTWAPDIVWSAPVAGTNDELITIDSTHSIPAKAIQAQSITTTLNLDEYNQIFMRIASRDALDASAKLQGWRTHVKLDADGPGGTTWGYKIDGDDGIRFLIISANGKDCTTGNDRPVECSTFDAKVTVTDELSPLDDL